MRRLRVGIMTSARTWRGSTVSLSGIAAGLQRRGHAVRLFAGEEQIVQAVLAQGVPAVLTPLRNTGLREIRALRAALRSSPVDVFIADRPRDLRLGALATAGSSTALVYRYNVRRPRPPADLLTRLTYRRLALTVFISRTHAAETLAAARFMRRAPWRVIYNGIDASVFRPDPALGLAFRERVGLGSGPVALGSGAFFPDKRFDILIRAMKSLGATAPTLVLCGTGVDEGRLRSLSEQLGVEVRFTGFLEPEALAGAYNAATVFLHACPVESFGRSVAEAMACGRPVVTVNAGPLAEVVGDAGVLVPPDDPAALGAACRRLLEAGAEREALGRLARTRCVERFSLERSLDDYESMCLEVSAGI
ncbi:MAG: glycosyltransferase family 4 protein [Gemmatimonadales bacterium]